MGTKETISNLEKLSNSHKKEAANFIAYLKAKEELQATKEIIRDKDVWKTIVKGDEDFKSGHFKKWSKVKQNV